MKDRLVFVATLDGIFVCGRFTFEGIRHKSRLIFTKERKIIRQKSGCLNHLNERIFQVNI